jgi:hypothetical protein
MSKLPFLQFYPADYLVDTRVLTLSARGAWVDILCILHGSSTRGTTKFPARGWARIMGVPEPDFSSALREIEDMKVGDVIRDSNGDVTVTCRRMMNESITREQTRLRVQNHRKKECNAGRNASSNADVTHNKSEVISQKSEAKNNTKTNTAPVPVASVTGKIEVAEKMPTQADAIWALYPKKSGKKVAFPEINSAIKEHGFEKIRDAVAGYASAIALWPNEETKFIPDPVRWFKQGKYDDDPEAWTRKTQKKPGGTSTYDLEAKTHGYTL